MKSQQYAAIVAIIILVGAGAFYGGMKYAQKSGTAGNSQARFAGANLRGGIRTGTGNGIRVGGPSGGFMGGEVIKKDATSITLKLPDGGSKIIFYTDTTKFLKSTEGAIGDIAIGENIIANGKANPDGSIMAETVQARPQIPGQGAGGAPGQMPGNGQNPEQRPGNPEGQNQAENQPQL